MALTEIQIANMALARLGNTNALTGTTVSSIPTLGEDGFAIEGQQVVAFYSHCRERTLRDYPWVFASKLAELDLRVTDDGTLPWSGRWTYEYAYPSDALLIRAVRSPGEARDNPKPNPFEVTASTSDRVIRTDVPDGAIGEYTLNITTVGIYSDDPKFVSALAWLLAFEMAPGLGVDAARQAQVFQAYITELHSAQRSDANEDQPNEEQDGSFVTAHRGG